MTRALASCLAERGCDLTVVAGSRHDLGGLSDARRFYAGIDLHEVDFTAALGSPSPMAFDAPAGSAPLQPSFEDRPGAGDRVFASLDDGAYERQVAAWARELGAAGAAEADVLHLHHLTPLNGAAALVAPDVAVVGQLHGTELMMLEAIEHDPGRWAHGPAWADRLQGWAARCARLVAAPGNLERAIELLDVRSERFITVPNGFDPLKFRPLEVDRRAVWQRVLVDEPRGWNPGRGAGRRALRDGGARRALPRAGDRLRRALHGGQAAAAAAGGVRGRAHADGVAGDADPGRRPPGEWEGEHPAETIDRLGLPDVLLAGWHDQSELPELMAASDLLVLPSARESFGQVIVEAMACGVPAVASAALGPAHIVDDGKTGWLFDIHDRDGSHGRARRRRQPPGRADPAREARRAGRARPLHLAGDRGRAGADPRRGRRV